MLDKYSMRPYAHVYEKFDFPEKVSDKNYTIEWNSLIGVMRIVQYTEIDNKPLSEVLILLWDGSFYYRSLFEVDTKFMPMREENFMGFDYGKDTELLYQTYRKFHNEYKMGYTFFDLPKDTLDGKRVMKLIYLETVSKEIQNLHNALEKNVLITSGWLTKYTYNEILSIFRSLENSTYENISELFMLDMPTFYFIAAYEDHTLDILLYARKLRLEYGFDSDAIRLLFSLLENYVEDITIYNYVKEIIYYTRDIQDILNFFDISQRYAISKDQVCSYLNYHSRECRLTLNSKRVSIDTLQKKLNKEIERYKQLKEELRENELKEHALELYIDFESGDLFGFSQKMTKLSMNLNSKDKAKLQTLVMSIIQDAFEKSVDNRLRNVGYPDIPNN